MTLAEEIPGTIEAPGVQRLSPRVVAVWRLGVLVWTLVLGAPVVVAGFVLERPVPFIVGVAILGLMAAWEWPQRRYARWGWRVGEIDIRTQQGVMWRRESVVLHARIQHVDTQQGPIERMFGLASVVIYTAGSVGAVVKIPGLPAPDAERLRDRLVELSGAEDAV